MGLNMYKILNDFKWYQLEKFVQQTPTNDAIE